MSKKPKMLCWRCPEPVEATTEFAGYKYCRMCAEVVMKIYPAVQHDPPVGFPGSQPGHPAAAQEILDRNN